LWKGYILTFDGDSYALTSVAGTQAGPEKRNHQI
jgi:hypothetical protein